MTKSSVTQIRERFDADVERFSNLETGQSATIDAPLSLTLIAEAAARVTHKATALLDVGCGVGNYSLAWILERLPNLDVILVDLSWPMLDRVVERVSWATTGRVTALQGDIRDLPIGDAQFVISIPVPPPCCTTCAKTPSGAAFSPGSTLHSGPAVHFGYPISWSIPILACNRSCGNAMEHISHSSKTKPIGTMSSTTSHRKTRRARSCSNWTYSGPLALKTSKFYTRTVALPPLVRSNNWQIPRWMTG